MEKERNNLNIWICPNCETPNSNNCEVCDLPRPLVKIVPAKKPKSFKGAFITSLIFLIILGFLLYSFTLKLENWKDRYYYKESDYNDIRSKASDLNSIVKNYTFSSGIPFSERFDRLSYFGNYQDQIFFTVHSDLIFEKVTVDAKGSGYLNGYIYDTSGVLICEASNDKITNGIEALEFDCPLKKGDYYITHKGNVQLLYNKNFSDYPISPDGFLTVTGNTSGSNYYMDFYDWEYSVGLYNYDSVLY